MGPGYRAPRLLYSLNFFLFINRGKKIGRTRYSFLANFDIKDFIRRTWVGMQGDVKAIDYFGFITVKIIWDQG